MDHMHIPPCTLIQSRFVFNRHLTCQIPPLSEICLSQWELRQRKGSRCLSRDMRKWRTARLMVSASSLLIIPTFSIYCSLLLIQHVPLYRRFVSTMPLLHPLLLSHHRCLLPCKDRPVFTNLPGPAGDVLYMYIYSTRRLRSQSTVRFISIKQQSSSR